MHLYTFIIIHNIHIIYTYIHMYRHQYELAVIHGRFGLLLSKWDKREGEGEKHVEVAREILHRILLTRGEKGERGGNGVYMSGTVHFPIDNLYE